MHIEDFIKTNQVADDSVSSVFGKTGVLNQFKNKSINNKENFIILYFKLEQYHNKNGSGIYYSVHTMEVNRSGEIKRFLPKSPPW